MLICPNCRVEYREGFRVCSDCDVPLEHAPARLSSPQAASPEPEGPAEDPFCSFWKGTDPRIHAEICLLLDEQSIPHKTVRREDHLFNLNNQPPFEIGIPFSQFEKAEAALREAYGDADPEDVASEAPTPAGFPVVQEPPRLPTKPSLLDSLKAALLSPSIESEQNRSGQDQRPLLLDDDWFPEDATAEAWRGDDPLFQNIFVDSLRENEIRCRWDDRDGHYSLWVYPKDADRAREIIRQIIQGTPEK